MSAHTSGPWAIKTARANEANGAPIHCEIQGGNYVVVRLGTLHGETARANARLIAAAPDLLAALKEAANAENFVDNPWLKKARAAIAKAEGVS